MAVFLLRARHGGAYTPPTVAASRFTDVPAGYWAQDWIEQLAVEGITTGCAPNQFCPADTVGRDQMAAFLARTFHSAAALRTPARGAGERLLGSGFFKESS